MTDALSESTRSSGRPIFRLCMMRRLLAVVDLRRSNVALMYDVIYIILYPFMKRYYVMNMDWIMSLLRNLKKSENIKSRLRHRWSVST